MSVTVAAQFLDEKIEHWKKEAGARAESPTGPKPLILGVSGPQGGGKSYLADKLLEHLSEKHPELRALGMSIDDFYLTHEEQAAVSLAAREVGNFVLEGRGLPGTHDVSLALEVMTALVNRKPCRVPVYDKSAYSGAGDRMSIERWQKVPETGVDVVIFEGWFTGFCAIDETSFPSAYLTCDPSGVVARSCMHHLQDINRDLRKYEPLWRFFDYFVYLQAQDLDYIYRWRQQQEDHLKLTRGSGMSDDQVTAFVRRYMPMYHLYYWRMCRQGVLAPGRNLQICIDLQRRVLSSQIL